MKLEINFLAPQVQSGFVPKSNLCLLYTYVYIFYTHIFYTQYTQALFLYPTSQSMSAGWNIYVYVIYV